MIFDKYVYPFHKKEYIKGKKPNVDCILCGIVNQDIKVESLVIAQTDKSIISVNLYPYNSGHILIFPKRHLTDIRNLDNSETLEISNLTNIMLDIIEDLYKPSGFNIGYNIGKFAGASIDHLHEHIIPRYPNELGIIDIIGGSRVIIENPKDTQINLISALKKYCNKNNINYIIFNN